MDLETIRKVWSMLGTVLVMIGIDLPGWLQGLTSPEGTDLIFVAIGAVVAVFQFVKSRTGKDKPAELNAKPVNTTVYALWPFKAA